MLCTGCRLDLEGNHFINNKEMCYKCVYRLKCSKSKEKIYFCKECNSQIKKATNKINQRKVYCSKECAKKGAKKTSNNFWTKVLATNHLLH